jgi:hypothetical protein
MTAAVEPEEDRAYGGHEQEAEAEAVSIAVVVAAAIFVVLAVVAVGAIVVEAANHSCRGQIYRSLMRLTEKGN